MPRLFRFRVPAVHFHSASLTSNPRPQPHCWLTPNHACWSRSHAEPLHGVMGKPTAARPSPRPDWVLSRPAVTPPQPPASSSVVSYQASHQRIWYSTRPHSPRGRRRDTAQLVVCRVASCWPLLTAALVHIPVNLRESWCAVRIWRMRWLSKQPARLLRCSVCWTPSRLQTCTRWRPKVALQTRQTREPIGPPAPSASASQPAAASPSRRRPPAPRVCAAPGCGATRGLHGCGGCGTVRYCSAQCSRAHWREHRADCPACTTPSHVLQHMPAACPQTAQ